jgi:hypothetical protein
MSNDMENKTMDKNVQNGKRNGTERNGTADQVTSAFFKPKFTGDCDALRECIFDCSESKQGGAFQANMKKLSIFVGSTYKMGSYISVLLDSLIEVLIPLPVEYRGSDNMQAQIADLKLVQCVKDQESLEMETKKLNSLVYGQCTELIVLKVTGEPYIHDYSHQSWMI